MYRIWYWATVDRESDGRFIANIPDLGDLAAHGDTDKDAVAHVTDLAGERVRAAIEGGQQVPHRRHSSEMPNHMRITVSHRGSGGRYTRSSDSLSVNVRGI
jgi:predicted RNase H-like HicB family nuclease